MWSFGINGHRMGCRKAAIESTWFDEYFVFLRRETGGRAAVAARKGCFEGAKAVLWEGGSTAFTG